MIPTWVQRAIEQWMKLRRQGSLTIHHDGYHIKKVEWPHVVVEEEKTTVDCTSVKEWPA